MNKKLLYKILGVLLIVIAFLFITLAIIDLVQVSIYNQDLLPTEPPLKTKMWYSLVATPFMFGGFFLVILGWGSKKEHVQK